MELQQLRYFIAVAETGNFTRAAAQCHVSQPSLSQQILKLEEDLGRRLFDRLPRKAVLTDAGQLLYERATEIIASVEDATKILQEADPLEGGHLAVGAIPTVAPHLLPAVVKSFVQRFPKVEVTVKEDLRGRLLSAVIDGKLDIAIMAAPVDDEHVECEPLLEEPLLLTLPASHRLAGKSRVKIADLNKERFVVLHEGHQLSRLVQSLFEHDTTGPNISCVGSQISTIQAMVAMGLGVSLLPRMAVRDDRSSKRVYLPLADAEPMRKLIAVQHRHRHHSPASLCFMEELKSRCEKMAERE